VQFGLGAVLQHSIAPSLRVAGSEDEDDDEDSLSDVAFCARWLAVLSASEVGRTKAPCEAILIIAATKPSVRPTQSEGYYQWQSKRRSLAPERGFELHPGRKLAQP